MEQFIFLLVIIVISIIKWLMEKSAEQRAKRQTADRLDRQQTAPPLHTPRPTAGPASDLDEAARRLREALGLPDDADMPPPRDPEPRPTPVAPPPLPEPVPTFQVEEVQVFAPADLEHRVVVQPPPIVQRRAQAFRRQAEPAPVAMTSARSALGDLLSSREGLRKAILAQEILGTPKGLVF